MKRVLAFILGCCMISSGFAQSILHPARLAEVKKSLSEPVYAIAYQELLKQADAALEQKAVSVVMKEQIPASGDKHDYMSLARYFWPDLSKPDGKPYVRRDGISNPELDKYDHNRMGDMVKRVETLSLAWYFSGEEKYARKATELLRTWFLNPATRMNPNLNYAQVAPGHGDDRGRCYGLIDTYSFVGMLDAVQLLEGSQAFTNRDSKQLKNWFSRFLDWFLESEPGRTEAQQSNNHSVAYDVQVVAYAKYTGNLKLAEQYIRAFPRQRIFRQIEPDGKQPHELKRTLSFGYSVFNLQHMTDLMQIAQKLGIEIWNETSEDGRNFYKAADFLAGYLGKEVSAWPYQQLSGWQEKQQELCQCLYRIYLLNPSRTDYLKLYKTHRLVDRGDRKSVV